nr:fatty acid desaturase [Methylorubrum aminovorans]
MALRQVADTLLPYLILCAVMLGAAANGYALLALPLAVPAGGLLVRLFIIQHDCGHGSFLPSRRGNDGLGRALSLLTVTPYDSWKRAHALHHATTGDLSRRGTGDVHTLTVREYLALPRWGRLRYRLYRNPLILIVLGSPINFLILQRLPPAWGCRGGRHGATCWRSTPCSSWSWRGSRSRPAASGRCSGHSCR